MWFLTDMVESLAVKQRVILPIFPLIVMFISAIVLTVPRSSASLVYAQESPEPILLQEPSPKKMPRTIRPELTKKSLPEEAGPPPETPTPALNRVQEEKIIEKNSRIRKLQQGIIDHKIKILGSKRQERSLLDDLEEIEKELQEQKKLLAALQEKSEKQELLLSGKQEYLKQVLTEKRKHQVLVKKRLAAFYRMGSVGPVDVVFSTESLPELLDFEEYFKRMVEHDHAIIQQYLTQIKESNRAREEHAREKLKLMQMAGAIKNKETELAQLKQEKNLMLQKVNTEQQLYEQAVSEIEAAVTDLAATLQRIQTSTQRRDIPGRAENSNKTGAARTAAEPAEDQEGFPGRKGLLDPPVAGTVISLYGHKLKGKFDSSTTANGINIRVDENAEIRAVYDGKVIHAGYLRGYGNLMIIDHGRQYFSLISGAAEFYQKEGSRVETGEIIGIAGEGDSLYGEGIHFEIRRGSNPVDPLLWLKKNALPVQIAGASTE